MQVTVKHGRPRSPEARNAVLRAVDDLLREVGYAQVTMKAIAERAGVSRQTVYRWWSSPAEVLLEASVADAAQELQVDRGSAAEMVAAFRQRLATFLIASDAGLAYRALLGAAQQDQEVATLLRSNADPLRDAAWPIARAVVGPEATSTEIVTAVADLIGPILYQVMSTGSIDEGQALS